MRFDIRYRCRFTYDGLVRESQNELRAAPATDAHQQVVSYRVQTAPSSRVLSFTDYWGTRVDAFGVREPHLVLDVVAEATVETRPRPLLTVDPRAESLEDQEFVDAYAEYLGPSPHVHWGSAIADEAAHQVEMAGPGVVSQVLALHRCCGSRITYSPGHTYVGVLVDDVFASGRGVCQDFAHLAVALCRSVGIPARYVSGYLFTLDDSTGADVEHPDGAAVRVQTHAWFEAAIPGFGWLGLDPTNGLEVGPRHVKIGHGRDYDDVPPLKGVFAGTAHNDLEVAVDIKRVGTPLPLVPSTPTIDPRKLARRDEEAVILRAEREGQQHQQDTAQQQQQQQ